MCVHCVYQYDVRITSATLRTSCSSLVSHCVGTLLVNNDVMLLFGDSQDLQAELQAAESQRDTLYTALQLLFMKFFKGRVLVHDSTSAASVIERLRAKLPTAAVAQLQQLLQRVQHHSTDVASSGTDATAAAAEQCLEAFRQYALACDSKR
jgi:hypothetical protein